METIEELKAKIAKLEQDKDALIGETTDGRIKHRAVIEEKDKEIAQLQGLLKVATDPQPLPDETKIVQLVETVLQKREQGVAVQNRKAAFDKFVNENKDYHPDNDPGGLKRAALEKELSGLTAWSTQSDVVELISVIGKADRYLRGTDTPRPNQPTVQVPSTPASVTTPPSTPVSELSEKEEKLIARTGMTKERFLHLKAKNPEYIETLLA